MFCNLKSIHELVQLGYILVILKDFTTKFAHENDSKNGNFKQIAYEPMSQ